MLFSPDVVRQVAKERTIAQEIAALRTRMGMQATEIVERENKIARLTERCDAYKEALEKKARALEKLTEAADLVTRRWQIASDEEFDVLIERLARLIPLYMCERHGRILGDHCPKCSTTYSGLAALATLPDKTP